MSEIRVTNVIGENGDSPVNFTKGINMSGICTAPAFIPSQGQLSHRNLITNGDFRINQRSSSSTSNGYHTMDRWYVYAANHSVTVTTAQVAITSGNAYDDGFRKAAKISLSGAGTLANNTEILFYQKIEAQDLANSGWNYKSASSNITLSFWVKSSVAQTFAAHIRTEDGTAYIYSFTYTVAQANVWQKITKTIPGNSNITINDDNGSGLRVYVGVPAIGSDYTSGTADTWVVSSTSSKFPTVPNNWLTAGASTFELTGVQLEVGTVATPFEHRSYGDELARCQRYFYKWVSSVAYSNMCIGYASSSTQVETVFHLPVVMRANPTFAYSGQFRFVGYTPQNAKNLSNLVVNRSHPLTPYLRGTVSGSASGLVGEFGDSGSNDAAALFSADL